MDIDWKRGYGLMQELLLILVEHNFLPQLPALRKEVRATIAEGLRFYNVAVADPPREVAEPPGPQPRQLDLITLECALAYTRWGVFDCHTNAGLDSLRDSLRALLELFGYAFDWTFSGTTLWPHYSQWAAVGEACQLPAFEIADRRAAAHRELSEGRGICFPAHMDRASPLEAQLGITRK